MAVVRINWDILKAGEKVKILSVDFSRGACNTLVRNKDGVILWVPYGVLISTI